MIITLNVKDKGPVFVNTGAITKIETSADGATISLQGGDTVTVTEGAARVAQMANHRPPDGAA